MPRYLKFRNRTMSCCVFTAALTFAGNSSSAPAEMQCAPHGASVQYPLTDRFWGKEIQKWEAVTKHRYLEGEGDDACTDAIVPGYEGYPTKRCVYKTADAGGGEYRALQAEVVLLDPGAEQLNSWSIHACRTNGATDTEMERCLRKLREYVVVKNSAQFPVVGSVVESYCNSSRSKYPNGCDKLPAADKGREPRNTWFRNGVSIEYADIQWDAQVYPHKKFDEIFDVVNSDKRISRTLGYARLAAATRQQWIDWRQHIENLAPEGVSKIEADVAGAGWQLIARDVHKTACRGNSNELFDAVVFAKRKEWIGK